ncbi:MAG: electron carrier [Caeruleum heppii]|nr:MAG: electron carrier [Caeruleum heppii]
MVSVTTTTEPWALPDAQEIRNSKRTLLLSPPSLSSHPETLNKILSAYDRNLTDIQMLDRVALGHANLPASTYDQVLILTDPDGTRAESSRLIGRDVLASVVNTLRTGGTLLSQDGTFAVEASSDERREAILAGLMFEATKGLWKPDSNATQSVPLRLGRKKVDATPPVAKIPETSSPPALTPNGKRKSQSTQERPSGVGFVDFSNDLEEVVDGEDDDELIDEDTLLSEEDLAKPIMQLQAAPECRPRAGKRRRACKDCTCGLKEKIEAEDATKRANADDKLKTMRLDASDLAEVDFTVQGKIGSCGNCALGDAFRCDGCPYIGMPAFKPGEEVRLLNNDIQL